MSNRGDLKRELGIASLAFCTCSLARNAHADPTAGDRGGKLDVVGTFGMIAPATSDYRSNANGLGYDRQGWRWLYQLEVAALFRPGWFGLGDALSIGPNVRATYGRLGAPYDSVPTIDTDALLIGATIEARISRFPVVFLWTDLDAGAAWVGPVGAHQTSLAWSARVGPGLRFGSEQLAGRLRVGYEYTPAGTFGTLGSLDLGGLFFSFDGVFRALD
ncbi:MAG: hypothetical protein ACHREM_18095 [Polyangiales bacterium]